MNDAYQVTSEPMARVGRVATGSDGLRVSNRNNGPKTAPSEHLRSCPLCAGSAFRPLPRPGHWIGSDVFGSLQGVLGLVQCHGCGLVFTNPRPSTERLEAYYAGDNCVCHETAASSGSKAALILDRMAPHLSADTPRTLLDYGAGGGGFMLHARDRGWKVRGFEPGRRGLEACRAAGLDATSNTDELPSLEFGLVTLHHVFEHLADPVGVLRSLRRLMAPSGRLYIEVPNARSLRARLCLPLLSRRCGLDERHRAFPIHLMYYRDRTLRRMVERAGWQIETTFTMGLGADGLLGRADPTLSPRVAADRPTPAPSRGPRRFRHAVRDAFLGLGLGEHLALIARPRTPQPASNRSRTGEGGGE